MIETLDDKTYANPLKHFDFSLLEDSNFKEDSVREELIKPLLDWLGFAAKKNNEKQLLRSPALSHPFVTTGANKKRKILSILDYLLKVQDQSILVLDAKSPQENIQSGKHQDQAYFYAIHPEIRSDFYALCNGHSLVIWHISETCPRINIELNALDNEKLAAIASLFGQKKPEAMISPINHDFDYLKCTIPPIIKPKKQAAKRHFGVNAYLTRQSWDVVNQHIRAFTQSGDRVIDPFGGSGVTAVEAAVLGRIGIHLDLNPISVFMAKTMLTPIQTGELAEARDRVLKRFERLKPNSEDLASVQKALETYPQPQNITMISKGSDFDTLYDLFTDQQRAELSCLKHCIQQEKNKSIQMHLMLAFRNTIDRVNLTFHETEKGGGANFVHFYRFRQPSSQTFKYVTPEFNRKADLIIKGKNEINSLIGGQSSDLAKSQALKGNACALPFEAESVDYIYTDPPYGSKIHYLDLSAMWNAWLDFEVSEEDYENEAIEGGSHEKSRESYDNLLTGSLQEMFRVLKWNRWMSFVFQHQDPHYWHVIVDSAEKIGFEYMGTVRQSNGQTSFKKRKNPFTVLSGQLIIYFRKVKSPKARMQAQLGADIQDLVFNRIESLIAQYDGATLEEIYAALITDGLEMGYGDLLAKEYQDITPLLNDHYEYEEETKKYQVKPKGNFKTHIDLKTRVRYFLTSYLRRHNRNNEYPSFDNIVYDIMPQLKNGKTPENQTIRNELEIIAYENQSGWKLREASDRLKKESDQVGFDF